MGKFVTEADEIGGRVGEIEAAMAVRFDHRAFGPTIAVAGERYRMTTEAPPMTLAAAHPRPPEFDPAPDRIDPTNASRIVARTTFRSPSALLIAALLFSQLLPASHGQPPPDRAAPPPPAIGAPLPAWLREWDVDSDGQVSFFEWRMSGAELEAFSDWDLNGDGFITPEEVARRAGTDSRVRWVGGEAVVQGTVEQRPEKYRERAAYRVLTVDLEAGRAYRFELVGAAFQAFLFIEDAAGEPLAEGSSRAVGAACKLTYRAERTGRHRVVATSAAGYRTGPFNLTARIENLGGTVPPWYEQLDADRDGQVSLYEWRTSGKAIPEFLALDRNNDGYVTPAELAWVPVTRDPDLKFVAGRLATAGTVAEAAGGASYRGKVSYRVLTVDLEAGKTYRLAGVSPAFQMLVFVEDAAGAPLAEAAAAGVGEGCGLTYRAERTGRHRFVVTSVGGFRIGPFDLTARVEYPAGTVPPWFEKGDADHDGQVSLYEWRTTGGDIDAFPLLDLNGDGYLTAEELRRVFGR